MGSPARDPTKRIKRNSMKNVLKVHDCAEMLATEIEEAVKKEKDRLKVFIEVRRKNGWKEKMILESVENELESNY